MDENTKILTERLESLEDEQRNLQNTIENLRETVRNSIVSIVDEEQPAQVGSDKEMSAHSFEETKEEEKETPGYGNQSQGS